MSKKLPTILFCILLSCFSGRIDAQTFGQYQVSQNKNGTFNLKSSNGQSDILSGYQEIKPLAFAHLLYDIQDDRYLLCTKGNKREIFSVASGIVILSHKTESIDFVLPTDETVQFIGTNRIPVQQPEWIVIYTDKGVSLLHGPKSKIIYQSEFGGMEIFTTRTKSLFRTSIRNYNATLINREGRILLDQCMSLSENQDGTFVIERDYRFGLADATGKILVAPCYQRITSYDYSHHFLIAEDTLNKAGVITTSGVIRIPFEYDINDYSDFEWAERINYCHNNIFFLHKNNTMWIVDSTNKPLTDVPLKRYDRRFEHPEFVKVFQGDLEGMFNTKSGKLIIAPIYTLDYVEVEDELLNKYQAIGAIKDGKWGLLSLKDGSTLIPFEYQPDVHNKTGEHLDDYGKSISRNFKGYNNFVLKKNGLFGIIDIHQNTLMPFEFEQISRGCKKLQTYKLILVKKNGLFGLYDAETYQEVIPPVYNQANCDLRLKKTTNGVEEVFYVQPDRTLKSEK